MTLKEIIGQNRKGGEISVGELFSFIDSARWSIDFRNNLKNGAYVVLKKPFGREFWLERVDEIDHLEPGDYRAAKGTSGGINGNVYIKDSKYPVFIVTPNAGKCSTAYRDYIDYKNLRQIH